MLQLLHIENIAIIEHADISFERGFNALTGETGAGKSIVIDALGAVLGQRTSRDLIRTGANKAFVSAAFDGVDASISVLGEYGVSRPEESSDGWRSTLLAAMKQSCNPFLPLLAEPVDFSHALSQRRAGRCDIFGASPGAEGRALALLAGRSAEASGAVEGNTAACRSIWIGPEGGFSPREEELLMAAGIAPVTLETCVLRVETAVPALVGFLLGRNWDGE